MRIFHFDVGKEKKVESIRDKTGENILSDFFLKKKYTHTYKLSKQGHDCIHFNAFQKDTHSPQKRVRIAFISNPRVYFCGKRKKPTHDPNTDQNYILPLGAAAGAAAFSLWLAWRHRSLLSSPTSAKYTHIHDLIHTFCIHFRTRIVRGEGPGSIQRRKMSSVYSFEVLDSEE